METVPPDCVAYARANVMLANCVGRRDYTAIGDPEQEARVMGSKRVVFSPREGRKIAIMTSGRGGEKRRLSIMGAKSVEEMQLVCSMIQTIYAAMGISIRFGSMYIDNLMVILYAEKKIDVRRLAATEGALKAQYNPETISFVKLPIVVQDGTKVCRVSCLVYETGSVVITGSNNYRLMVDRVAALVLHRVRPYYTNAEPRHKTATTPKAVPVRPATINWENMRRSIWRTPATRICVEKGVQARLSVYRPVVSEVAPGMPLPKIRN